MKNQDQIAARIKELRAELVKVSDNPTRHKRGQKGHGGNLGIRHIRELGGEIRGLEWVLENSGDRSN